MYLMMCTRPDLAYPLSLLAHYVAPATQRSSQGYTFSLGSGSVSWRSTRSSSVLSSCCEAEIYGGAMATQELGWLTYLLTDLGEQPRSPPVLYVDNKAMIALCKEHRLEQRTKQFALRYFLARELQQHGQLHLAYVATQANTADVFTKAVQPCDHQRLFTVLGLVPTLPHLLALARLALLFLTGLKCGEDFGFLMKMLATTLDDCDVLLRRFNPTIDWTTGACTVPRIKGCVTLPKWTDPEPTTTRVNVITPTRAIKRGAQDYAIQLCEVVASKKIVDIDTFYTVVPDNVASIFWRYPKIFADDLPDGLPPKRSKDHRIELEPGAQPTVLSQWQLSQPELDELRKQLDYMLLKGFI
ncbi:unnamed protein product [Closterium sp. NIES-53]